MNALIEFAAEERELADARLAVLVAARLNDEWTITHDADLYDLAVPVLSLDDVRAVFEDLCEYTRLRDGLDEGTVHWSDVCGEITGPDPSLAARDLASGWVDDATTSLIGS